MLLFEAEKRRRRLERAENFIDLNRAAASVKDAEEHFRALQK
jgi:hypothetical protein